MSDSSIPKTTKAWTVQGRNGFDSLKFHEDRPIPELGDRDVLVRIQAVSLNYRDIIIPKVSGILVMQICRKNDSSESPHENGSPRE